MAESLYRRERDERTVEETADGDADANADAVVKETESDPAEFDPDELDPDEIDPDEFDPEDLVRTESGELMHEESGLIVEEQQIDRGPEWRAFDQKERSERSRVGSPVTKSRHDEGLTTEIGWRNEDAQGRSLSHDKRRRMERLRTWQQRIRTQKRGERNLQFALSEVGRMSSALGIPDSVQEVASVIYRRALDEDLIRGRSIEAVATAALYAGMRQEGIPRSLDEVADVSRVGKDEVGRAYRYLSQELGLELQPIDPAQYVPRFCAELDADDAVAHKAEEILEEVTAQGMHAGKSPTGYAGAAIYLASMLCNRKHTQQTVADVADVTQVTIRNGYQEQMEALGLVSG